METTINKNTAQALKGIFAVGILLHHFTTMLPFTLPYCGWIKYIAFPLVGAFFFLSGYGLMYGLTKKENYLKGFIPKRFSKVLVPFVLVAGAATAVLSAVKGSFVNAFSIFTVLQYWFVYVILGAYLLFYLVFKLCGKTAGTVILFAAAAVYAAVCLRLLPERDEMFASIIAFPLGVLFKIGEPKIAGLFKKGFAVKCAALFFAFFGAFTLRLLLAYKGMESAVLHTLLRNLVTALFVCFIGVLAQRLTINNRLLLSLGACSYEIYIIHPVLIHLYRLIKSPADNRQLAVMIVVVVATTLLSAYLLHLLLSKTIFNGGKNNVKET